MVLAIAGGGPTDQALEGAGEGALFGKAREEGDFGERMRLVPQQPFGEFPAGFFRQRLEAHAVIGEPAVERPDAEAQVACDVGHLRRAFAERPRDGVLGLLDKRALVANLGKLRVKVGHEVAGYPLVPELVGLLEGRAREELERIGS